MDIVIPSYGTSSWPVALDDTAIPPEAAVSPYTEYTLYPSFSSLLIILSGQLLSPTIIVLSSSFMELKRIYPSRRAGNTGMIEGL